MIKETIYVIGHKSPDTDSVCSAVVYAEYLKIAKKMYAVPAAAGELNAETKFVLNRFKTAPPEFLSVALGKKLVLVDHNEKGQSVDGIDSATVLEVIDHHKIVFACDSPIRFTAEPVGSTATIVAKIIMADKKNFKLTKKSAGLLLSAILSDTVFFKSATTTPDDINVAKKLGRIAGIKKLVDFGIEIKKQKASLKGLCADKIFYSDFKIFAAGGKKFGVGQIEVCGLEEADRRQQEILEAMKLAKQKENLNLAVLMVTDIIKEGSKLLAVGETAYVEKAFGKTLENDSVYIDKAMSRKKEILPPLMRAFGG
jgi:manganese-dependent inorganic pyrophosphatase